MQHVVDLRGQEEKPRYLMLSQKFQPIGKVGAQETHV